ncbi:NAD-dependent epimerase/dehydratase family protein [bacterium]|nr:NAD-dependent epimerase/dehydratase family protein [bacterium]
MKYLVTGGSGFVGSHLCERLLADGNQVLVLDNLSTGRYGNIANLEGRPGFELRVGSVNDYQLVEECVRECNAVFHLASAVGVRLIVDQPVLTIESIVNGTDNVLRACSRYRRRTLITSTSEVYGKSDQLPFREDGDSVIGATTTRRWAYACAKALDEFLGLAHWHETRLPVVIVRLFNTVGPRQTGQYGMVIPRFVRQALAGEPITVYGDGSQARCFGHVKDVIEGIVGLMNHTDAPGKVFNIGNDEETTIMELAKRILAMTGSKSEIEIIPFSQAYPAGFEDMHRRIPDLTKIRNLLGYEPKRNLDAILKDVIDEFRAGQSI